MNETDIRKYAALMAELGLTGLEVTEQDRKVRLERNQTAPVQTAVPPAAEAPVISAPAGEEICSPMVGVFYAAPEEDAPPFVQVGDRVKKGQTLCILEAMKLMNELPAEADGVIVEICATNGQVVDYGCPLFRIRKEP